MRKSKTILIALFKWAPYLFVMVVILVNTMTLYSRTNLNHFIGFQQCDPGQWIMMNIEKNMDGEDITAYYASMDELANEHDLMMIQLLKTDVIDGVSESTLYVTSNESMLSDHVYLNNASLDDFALDYTSLPPKTARSIVSYFDGMNVLRVLAMTANREGGGLVYIHGDRSTLMDQVERWVSDMTAIYPNFSCNYQWINFDPSINLSIVDNGYTWLIAIILIAVGLDLIQLRQSRKVSLQKIDGQSSVSIFYHLVAKQDCVFLCVIFIVTVGYLLINSWHSTGLLVMMRYFIKCCFVGYSAFMVTRGGLLVWIIYIPVVQSIKGSHPLNHVNAFLLPIKAILGLLVIYQCPSLLQNGLDLFTLNRAYPQALAITDHYYTFGNQIKSNWFMDIGTDRLQSFYDDLVEDVGIFHSGLGYFDIDQDGEMEQAIVASRSFLDAYGLSTDNYDPNHILVVVNQDFKDAIEPWVYYLEHIYLSEASGVDVINTTIDFPLFNVRYLLDGVSKPYIVISIPADQQFRGQVNGDCFYYEGDAHQAQAMMDHQFLSHGYSPAFEINALSDNVHTLYFNRSTRLTQALMQQIAVVILYFMVSIMVYLIDGYANHKKYHYLIVEGNDMYRMMYRISLWTPFIVAWILCIILTQLSVMSAATILIGILLIVDIVLSYWIYPSD